MDNPRPRIQAERDRRRDRRARVLHGARIDFVDEPVTIDCRVRDLSQSGARLETEHADYLPTQFSVAVDDTDETATAKRVWTKDGEVGVVFVTSRHSSEPNED
ncbi:MAG TPA: PilZ domain-containing protein [Afifellaceae bacterium]|nr:PilZ domain-containing protein [Afifellaceae bacterium]